MGNPYGSSWTLASGTSASIHLCPRTRGSTTTGPVTQWPSTPRCHISVSVRISSSRSTGTCRDSNWSVSRTDPLPSHSTGSIAFRVFNFHHLWFKYLLNQSKTIFLPLLLSFSGCLSTWLKNNFYKDQFFIFADTYLSRIENISYATNKLTIYYNGQVQVYPRKLWIT